MKKYLLLLAACCLTSAIQQIHAQVEKNVLYKVAIGDFSYTPKEDKEEKTVRAIIRGLAKQAVSGKTTTQQPDYANDVQASIVKGFGNVVRFRAIEGDFYQEEIGEDEPAFYVDGNIANISTTTRTNKAKDKQAEQQYSTLISVTINLKDVHTEEMVDSRMFSIREGDCGWMSSAEQSISSSLSSLAIHIAEYYNNMFPLSASIIERGEIKKKKQKTVYIDLGSKFEAYKGQQFDIFSLKTIAGKEARIEIGRLKIDEVLGEDISLCKVTRGEEEVKEALDGGATLIVITRD